MALRFPDRLESNNPSAYGIVKAIEVSGHKTVSSLSALCNVPDCILSVSGNNTNNDAIGQLWYVVDENKIYQLTDWENRNSQDGWSEYGGENVTKEELEEALAKKQDKLTAGTGIEITEDNVISCTLDTQIFEFVDELPPLTEAKENKIYLVPKDENVGEYQAYIEYIVTNVVDEAGFPTKTWEKIGEYDLGIELAPYLKIADAEATYVKKTDVVNNLEGGTEEQVLGAQMGAELKKQIDQLNEDTVHSVTATPEKGIIIEGTKNDPTVGILRDPESEEFLSLGEAGLKLSGVQDAINTGDDKVREEYKADMEEMQSHTEYLYDINSLFPGQGQGDGNDQWTITRALAKLDSILPEEDRKSGIKCKFINSDGEWVTYTFYGGDLLDENNWAYDLTSKDFNELASQIPVATPESNGMMSAEDKKKFDELKEGIEDGRSVLDEINDAVQEAKEIIDAYTVNGYEISSNPVLNKADIGLDQVDNTSDMDKPVSTAQKEAHDKLQSHTEYLYNINTLFPNAGSGDNSDQWSLQSAIVRLDASLSDEEKIPGIKIKFITEDGKWRTYTYYGDNFTSTDSWNYDITSKDFEELATTDLPTATQESNGTMSKEDKKKLDDLSEGIEDGVSIVDKINEIVGENKEIIDNYTVNGHKISENPVLGKADVGLDQVDNTSDMDKPISNATQEKFDELESHTEILYNINDTFPGEGSGENNDQWNLQTAIARLDAFLTPEQEKAGIKIKFITEDGNWRTYTYYGKEGDSISNSENWKYDLTSQDFEELATTNLPTATQEANGTMSKEDKKILDTLAEGMEEGVSIIDKIDEKVEEAKNIIDNYTVNGYKISENPVLNKADVGLDQVTNDAQVKRSEMGVQNGVATLDENGKVPSSQLPDSVLGNVRYIGVWDASLNEPLLENGNEDQNGYYYIVTTPGTQFGYDFDAGDWVINSAGTWSKVDNVDAVKSVNGQTGIVELEIEDIPNLREELDQKVNITDFNQTIQELKDSTDTLYNVTDLFPGEGSGDKGNVWTLQLAVSKLDSYVPEENKIPGTKCKFLGGDGKWRTYTFYGPTFADPNCWSYDLTSKDFEELATTDLPTATQEANGVMSKEDKKKLDVLSEGMDGETSIVDQITEAVDAAKEELQNNIDTTKEELQGNIDKVTEDLTNHISDHNNPHQVNKEQVGLGNVTNDAQVKRSEMAVPNGVATLDENGRIPEEQIQERQLQNVKYIGLWSAASNEPQLQNNTPERSGDYYVVNTAGEQLGISFEPGDWIINNGGTWQKVDNTESVTSVNGKRGDVVIEMGDIEGLLDELNSKATGDELEDLTNRVDEISNSIGKPAGLATLDGDGQLVVDQIPEEAINVLEGTLVNNSTFNDVEGETIAHQKNTIYVDTVTNKIYRWGESSYQELATISGITSDLQAHIDDKNNPHQVTKEQVGLGNVTDDAQVKRDEMGVANGVATLNESGKIPVEQLPGQVDEVFGIDHFVDTKTEIPVSRLVIGETYYVKNEKKIYTALSESELDEGKTPEKGVIYSDRGTNLIYRWDGAELVELGNIITIGENAGEAYPGDKGKETTDKVNSHVADLNNPHQVTKEQVGLGNVENIAPADLPISNAVQEALDNLTNSVVNYTVNGYKISENPVLTKADIGLGNADNTSDLDKPISTATQAALDKLNEDLSRTITTHVENFNNPHKVTKDQVGLGNVDNTADINKPVSIAQQAAIDAAKADMNSSISNLKNTVENHISNTSNPHQVNKEQVGLGKVDNTSDLEKPVSAPQQEAINAVKESVNDVGTDLSAHLTDYSNPHRVTKDQVGLGKVDNTSDLEKPISTATQDALNSLNTNIELAKTEIGNYTISGHKISENPILTKDDVGLSNIDNTSDINKPISHLTQDALDALEAKIDSIGQTTDNGLKAHLADFNNPHKVTKDQIGLGNVENLSPSDYPISDATQEAINNVNDTLTELINNHISNSENPHNVTKDQIGLGNVTDDAQVKRDEMGVPGGVATLGEDGKVPSSQLPSFVDDVLEYDSLDLFPETGEAGKIYVAKDTNITYRWSGTRYIEISKSLALGETSSTAYPGDKGKDTTDKLTSHLADFNNPHQVTKEQVGLGNVDNTADKDKPISDATQTALDEIKSSIESGNSELNGELNAHITNYNNPHKVTATQLGLDKVNNTSDLDKPISTATQAALDKLTETITSTGTDLSAHLIDFDNPHRVTKDQVGLGNVDNTSDRDKPISDATREAIDSLDDKIDEIEKNQSADLSAHLTDFNNPHRVTKDQVGLGNVDNTADKDKPVSDATTKAISDAKAELNTALTSHINNRENPHQVTKAQVGLDQVDNTSDANKPVSGPQQTALNGLSDKLTASLENHTTNYSNPHKVTKDQIGLGKVDNTSDLEKPVSAATEKLVTDTKTELQELISQNGTDLSNHLRDYNNPHQVTKEQVGLGNVDNTSDLDKPISDATQAALDGKVDKGEDGLIDESQLPRRTLHSMFYKGFWDANLNSPALANGNADEDGDYYLVTNGGLYFGYQFMSSDIVFNANGNWYRLMGSAERDEETAFLITKFVADQYQFEKGSSATINFEWEYQMTPDGQVTFQNINQYNIPVEERTYQINGITTDTTFILNTSFLNKTAQAEIEIKFYDKFYVGTSSKNSIIDTDLYTMDTYFVDGVTEAPFKLYDCSGGKYIYVAIPSEVADNYIIFCNGVIVNDTVDVTRTVVNSSGGSAEYKIMRFTNKYNGTLSVVVKLLSNFK